MKDFDHPYPSKQFCTTPINLPSLRRRHFEVLFNPVFFKEIFFQLSLSYKTVKIIG
jgi:hypothetical protein